MRKSMVITVAVVLALCIVTAFTSGCFTVPTPPPAGGCAGGGCSVPVGK